MQMIPVGKSLIAAAAAGVATTLVVAVMSGGFVGTETIDAVGPDSQVSNVLSVTVGDAGQTESDRLAALTKVEDSRRATWMSLLPKIKQANAERAAAAVACQQDVDTAIQQAMESVSADAFAEMVTGWESTWQRLHGETAHSVWMMGQFQELVFDDAELTSLLQRRIQQIHQQLCEIDSELLIVLQADVPLSPENLQFAAIDCSGMEATFRPAIDQSGTYLAQAWGESVFAQLAGTAAATGLATGIQALGYADDGAKSTPQLAVIELITTFATEVIAAELVEQAISTKGELARCVEDSVRSKLDDCRSGNPGAAIWTDPLWSLVLSHETVLTQSLIDAISVEPVWAMEVQSNYELPVEEVTTIEVSSPEVAVEMQPAKPPVTEDVEVE